MYSLTWGLHVMASTSHLFSLIGANVNFRSQSVFFCSQFLSSLFISQNEEMKFRKVPGNIYQVITGVSRL